MTELVEDNFDGLNGHFTIFVPFDRLIIFGGSNQNNLVLNDVYNYFISEKQFKLMNPVIYSRYNFSIEYTFGAPFAFIVGGWSEDYTAMAQVEKYDIFNQKSHKMSDLNEARL